MAQTVIKIENLSKIYRLGEVGTGTLSHDLNRWWAMNIRGKEDPFAKVGHLNDRTAKAEKGELVAALSDINLEVKQGEILGIIGKNGAGKSTLLKILSRVTSPTTGSIKVKGRMASLLEVGTGFHPEMTGRENIYMNGTIMGMRRWEIDKKLDEIVEFAGVAKYLDTPVKRYSSGMTVRLGFAIAAHLEPEILIVDEVLAVGDAEFQKKSLGKMKDVSEAGRTVLFVSHNLAAIQNLCAKVLYLKQGKLEMIGETADVIRTYLASSSQSHAVDLSLRRDRKGNGLVTFTKVLFKDEFGKEVSVLQSGGKAVISIQFDRKDNQILVDFHVAMGIDDEFSQRIVLFSNEVTQQVFNNVNKNSIEIHIPKLPLKSGTYKFVLYSTVNMEIADWIQEAGLFEVMAGDFFNTGKLPADGQGCFFIDHSFQLA